MYGLLEKKSFSKVAILLFSAFFKLALQFGWLGLQIYSEYVDSNETSYFV